MRSDEFSRPPYLSPKKNLHLFGDPLLSTFRWEQARKIGGGSGGGGGPWG